MTHAANPADRILARLTPLAIVALVAALYGGTLGAPFIFDDLPSIVENERIRTLWPIWETLRPRHDSTLTGRPLVTLSLALNYALSGTEPWSYRLFNMAVHALAGLALYGVLRRALRGPVLGPRFGGAVSGLSAATALIWVAHPLVSECVTYVSTRTESMMGLCYLLTLYCAARAATATGATNASLSGGQNTGAPDAASRRAWTAAAVAACWAGMACKEVMVSAPLTVVLFDRAFLYGSFRGAWRRRRGLYGALAASWALLAALSASGSRGGSVGLGFPELSPMDYLRTQCAVVAHYLRLAVWPDPLVLDYMDWPVARSVGDVLPQALLLAALLAATVWANVRRPAVGFPGAWFFLILAPTSSVLPIVTEIAAERRMYLPLAAVVALIAGAAARLGQVLAKRTAGARRWVGLLGWAGALAATIGLGTLTWRRNTDYQTEVRIWRDAVDKRPANARAMVNLGRALLNAGLHEQALEQLRHAVRIRPGYTGAHESLGIALQNLDRFAEAIPHLRIVVRDRPDDAEARYRLAVSLERSGNASGAMDEYRAVLEVKPAHVEARTNLGTALAREGRLEEASRELERALRDAPDQPRIHLNVAALRAMQERWDDAERHLREALRLDPNYRLAHRNLGQLLAARGRAADAIEHLERALEGTPGDASALATLAQALAGVGRFEDAAQAAARAAARAREAGLVQEARELDRQALAYRERRAAPSPATQP